MACFALNTHSDFNNEVEIINIVISLQPKEICSMHLAPDGEKNAIDKLTIRQQI